MPLFEIQSPQELRLFRQLRGGEQLYESRLQSLFWNNTEEFTGESLFRVAETPPISGGGRPDAVLLDRSARVVVVEIKRDVDRGQLAQCLEYAGWARTTNLDELSGIYHSGPDQFFSDWQEFTDSAAPVRIRRSPRLILIARDFHGRTGSALEFLVENNLPVTLIPVAIYEDPQGRQFVDVQGEHEPEFPSESDAEGGTEAVDPTRIDGRRVRITDLMEAGLLAPGQELVFHRPRVGGTYNATVTDDATIELENGKGYSSPSRAAMEAAGMPSCDGWWAWRVGSPEGEYLHYLRVRLTNQSTQ